MPAIETVLFDLDGTLLDTLPDLGHVLNVMRAERNQPALPLDLIKPAISSGSKAMLKLAFDMDEYHPELSDTVPVRVPRSLWANSAHVNRSDSTAR